MLTKACGSGSQVQLHATPVESGRGEFVWLGSDLKIAASSPDDGHVAAVGIGPAFAATVELVAEREPTDVVAGAAVSGLSSPHPAARTPTLRAARTTAA
jgi:hypothetical protein